MRINIQIGRKSCYTNLANRIKIDGDIAPLFTQVDTIKSERNTVLWISWQPICNPLAFNPMIALPCSQQSPECRRFISVTTILKYGEIQDRLMSHQVGCGNELGDGKLKSITTVAGGSGIRTSDLLGVRLRPVLHPSLMCGKTKSEHSNKKPNDVEKSPAPNNS